MSQDDAERLGDICDVCGKTRCACRCCRHCDGMGVIGDTPGGRDCAYCGGTGDAPIDDAAPPG